MPLPSNWAIYEYINLCYITFCIIYMIVCKNVRCILLEIPPSPRHTANTRTFCSDLNCVHVLREHEVRGVLTAPAYTSSSKQHTTGGYQTQIGNSIQQVVSDHNSGCDCLCCRCVAVCMCQCAFCGSTLIQSATVCVCVCCKYLYLPVIWIRNSRKPILQSSSVRTHKSILCLLCALCVCVSVCLTRAICCTSSPNSNSIGQIPRHNITDQKCMPFSRVRQANVC